MQPGYAANSVYAHLQVLIAQARKVISMDHRIAAYGLSRTTAYRPFGLGSRPPTSASWPNC